MLPLLSCSYCFSRIALPLVRTNTSFFFFSFFFSQRFEKLCRCILTSMDVENEPKVSRMGFFVWGWEGCLVFIILCVGI